MILQMKNISKYYKSTDFILKNINLDIYKSEIIGIVGENGSGKSTILKMMSTLLEYDSGDIFFKGKSLGSMNDKELREMRKKVSYIFQDSNLLNNKTVHYHLSLVYKLNKKKVDNSEIDDILSFMSLSRFKNTKCQELSGGQRQKLSIAISLLYKPDLILCDEISSALDRTSEEEIYKLLSKIRDFHKTAIIIISHNLKIIKQYCDKVYFLSKEGIIDTIVPKKIDVFSDEKNYYNYIKGYLEQ